MKKPTIIAIMSMAVIAIISMVGFWQWQSRQKTKQSAQQTQTEQQNNSQEQIDISDWKTYRNEAVKFTVKYPNTFRVDNEPTGIGRVVSFMEFDEKAKNLSGQPVPGYFTVISIYQWKDINDPYLKGGNWEGEKNYANLQDFLDDSKNTNINVIKEINIDGVSAYVLSMPGEIGYEAIMFEYSGVYYRVSFPWTQKQLDDNVKKQFISSIKFLK